jgi:ABC-type Mn2+/Zn2+ transport system ATPase subunit
MSDEALIRCDGLVVGYGTTGLLPPVSVSIHKARMLAVLGRNGAGKSTWFRTVLGLMAPISGKIERRTSRIAYVAQASGVDPLLPVRSKDLVGWGRLSGWSFLNPFGSKDDQALAERALSSADGAPLGNRQFRQLSEGQKQKVLFARMLACDAEAVFLDEPTAAMDAIAERDAMKRLSAMAHESGKAVIVVSHSLASIAAHADQVLFLDREAGAVVAGTPKEVFSHSAFQKQFGEMELGHAAR